LRERLRPTCTALNANSELRRLLDCRVERCEPLGRARRRDALFEKRWCSSSAGCDFAVPLSIEEGSAVIQQGQVFKLQAGCADGEPMWAFPLSRRRRGSARLQVGGFSSKAEAQRALEIKLGRVLPDGRPANLTLGEWVEEYLETEAGYGSEAPLAAREGDRRAG
jgi:hypothetical protein